MLRVPKVASTVLVLLISCGVGRAQILPPPAPQAPTIKVTDATSKAELNDTIDVDVDGLSDWAKKPGNDASKFFLYLAGKPFKDLKARVIDVANGKLQFVLRRTSTSRDSWAEIYGKLFGHPEFFTRQVAVTIGLENSEPIPTDKDDFELTIISPGWFWTALALLVGAFLIFLWLAIRKDLLRDPGPEPAQPSTEPKQTVLRPFSLARSQMAFWFFIVIVSYMLIWMITGDYGSITQSVLGLTGISALTAVGAAAIDASKRDTSSPPSDGVASKGFLIDILSDGNTISFHRFQMAVWTIVLGIVFWSSVYNGLQMPEFSATLLGLMGISAGTYIGFKLT
jgi:hypothetical protein